MSRILVHVLGNSNAISTKDTDHTSLAVQTPTKHILVDCPGSPVQKALRAGLDLDLIDIIIITHRHPDHIYGLPSIIQTLGLLNRKKKLEIVGLEDTIETVKSMLRVFELEEFSGQFIKLRTLKLSDKGNANICDNSETLINATLVNHSVPTLAIKILNKETQFSATYSSDTAPSSNLINLAKNTNILIHECTLPLDGESIIHTNGKQVGDIAKTANANKLELVHLPKLNNEQVTKLIKLIRQSFSGPVNIPNQYDYFEI